MPVDLMVTIHGVENIVAGLSAAQDMSKIGRVTRLLQSLAQHIAKNIRGHAPERTGALKKTIEDKKVTLLKYVVQEGKAYGQIQRLGTKKKNYMIFPHKPPFALFWPGLKHPVKWVGEPYTRRHPGIKGDRYDLRGLKDSQSYRQRVASMIADTYALIITRGKGKI